MPATIEAFIALNPFPISHSHILYPVADTNGPLRSVSWIFAWFISRSSSVNCILHPGTRPIQLP